LKLRYFFSDFDGTLTERGEISKHLLDLLEDLKKKKITFVLVSGRSASWGHFFLTHFPISYAVMEAGGVVLHKDHDKKRNKINMQVLATQIQLKKLEKISLNLHHLLPELEMAVDNTGRITDRAIELDSLKNPKFLKSVQQFLLEHRCHYSVSNVHLNFSNIKNNKWSGVSFLCENVLKKKIDTIQAQSCFFGDAPNDEIMFKHFEHSVGVANILPYLNSMEHHPSHIAKKSEIKGVLQFLKDAAIL